LGRHPNSPAKALRHYPDTRASAECRSHSAPADTRAAKATAADRHVAASAHAHVATTATPHPPVRGRKRLRNRQAFRTQALRPLPSMLEHVSLFELLCRLLDRDNVPNCAMFDAQTLNR
jgi:hypothetical protein